MKKLFLLSMVAMLATGCATFRSYKNELNQIVENVENTKTSEALQALEKNSPKEKDLLYYMEKGELLRLQQSFQESIARWTEADQLIDQWENEAKITSRKVASGVGSFILNDKVRTYDGEDYEKVMLSTRQALNYLASGQQDDAMVEIKKTWERENLIKELHDKEIQKSEDEAKSKGYKTKSEDLKGYPIATLNSPEVLALKNGYQNAFSQYLSGFIAEASGDIGNAAAGYRSAIELQPSLETLKQHLAGLDTRVGGRKSRISGSAMRVSNSKKGKYVKHKNGKKNNDEPIPVSVDMASRVDSNQSGSDVLIVVENGLAPSKNGITIPLPIPTAGLVPISFPILESDPLSKIRGTSIVLPNNSTANLEIISNIDAMARRSLRDNMPYIMVRAAIRAALKGVTQSLAYDKSPLAGVAVNAVNVATEQADERIWKLLPSDIAIARVRLPEGVHALKIHTTDGMRAINVKVSGKYCVVPIRIIGKATYVIQKV